MTKIVSEAVQRDKGQLSKRANRNKGNVTYQQTANMKHRRLETAASKWNWTSTSIRRCSTARLYWEVTLHSNKTRRPATLFHHFDIVNSFWPVKLYSIFDQHLDLVVSIATPIVCPPSHLPRPCCFLHYMHGVAARWLLRDVPRFDARHVAARQCVEDKTGSHLRTWPFATVACSTWRDYEQTEGELLCASEKYRTS